MKNEEQIKRFTPSIEKGLPNDQVEERNRLGLVNKTRVVVGKTYLEIIFSDVFSFFNILLFVVAGFMVAAQYWIGLTFLVVLFANIGISLFEDIKARHLMSKLRMLTQPNVTVIRGGEESIIKSDKIVLDDLVVVESGNQICVDGVILEGTIIVDESVLTGESQKVVKNKGDKLLSGSYVISGRAYMHAQVIGEESYVETLHTKAKKFKRSPSEILKTLTYMFKVIGGIVVTLAIAIFVVYLLRGRFDGYDNFKESMKGISGAMISMIPSGLFLLTSVALAVGVLKLSKKGARVQDFYSVEMLARANVLCLDKTGTITSGEMDVKTVIPYGNNGLKEIDIAQIVSNLLHATKDNNLTAKSLQKAFNYELTKGIVDALPFNSENKYSAASFKGGDTYVLGALEFLNIKNAAALQRRTEEQTSLGLRVLVLGKAEGIKNQKVVGEVTPIALIVLQDHIKDEAVKTFEWFMNNGVQIRVISGDDALAVSHIASEAGIKDADKYISLAGLSDEEVIEAADKYIVFGRVTPDQKELLIQTLKNSGKTVAMVGDGVNDILALKRADCSIAMNNGSDAAKNVSHVVLLDSDFNALPEVVNEGRRVINNLQRTNSLFLVKTIFSMTTTLVFLITLVAYNYAYPFETTHFQIWTFVNIGLAAFLLALERNNDSLKGSFLRSMFRKAIPGAIAVMLPVLLIYLAYIFQNNNVMFTGIYDIKVAATMSVIAFTTLSLIVLLKICLPFSKYRAIVFAGAATLTVGLLVGLAFLTYKVGVEKSPIGVDFPSLTLVNWFVLGIIVILVSALYLIVTYIIEVFQGDHLNDKN